MALAGDSYLPVHLGDARDLAAMLSENDGGLREFFRAIITRQQRARLRGERWLMDEHLRSPGRWAARYSWRHAAQRPAIARVSSNGPGQRTPWALLGKGHYLRRAAGAPRRGPWGD